MRNTLIKASAGTGKTFALVTRVIRLLLLGVDPRHIVALTFSRAAAGEIFYSIAERLATDASDSKEAEKESKRIFDGLKPHLAEEIKKRAVVMTGRLDKCAIAPPTHHSPLTTNHFSMLLRRVIETQHICMIGTLDSFMFRMVKFFPLELGIQRAVTMLDNYPAEQERQRAVGELMCQRKEIQDTRTLEVEFHRATQGEEGKAYIKPMLEFIQNWHSLYL